MVILLIANDATAKHVLFIQVDDARKALIVPLRF